MEAVAPPSPYAVTRDQLCELHVLGKDAEGGKDLGQLVVFSGVSRFPVRVKCASLAWHTLKAALESEAPASVSTE